MVGTLVPLQFGLPGGPELLIILLIAVLLFGANKIPKLARSTGEAMGEFQKGREEVEQELNQMREGVENPGETTTTETTDATTTDATASDATTSDATTSDTTESDATDDETEAETERN
ncbi:MAG: twin-arginine translocase TatA/TatE family subunit [Haloarculaceae archaeon]